MSTVDIAPIRTQLHTIDWEFLQSDLFGKDLPKEKTWTGQKNILSVLKTIVARASNSHLLYTPDYEAEPLQSVKANWERYCLELTYSLTAVVRPEKLLYYSSREDSRLNYFHLICAPMQQTGLLPQEFYDQNIGYSEPPVQTAIVRYQTPEGLEKRGTLDINRIPSYVKRFYKGGDFVIFSKASMFYEVWKQDPMMLRRMDARELKAFIQKLAEEQTLRDE